MLTFKKDQMLFREGVAYRVVRPVNEFEIQLEQAETGQLSNHRAFTLMQEYVAGTLLTAAQRKHVLKFGPSNEQARLSMDDLSESAKDESRRRMDYIAKLEKMGAFDSSRKYLRSCIEKVATERHETRTPHETTVYRWRKPYLKAQRDVRQLFVHWHEQGGKGGTRLGSEVEAIIDDKIENILLAQKRSGAEEIHNAVFLEIQLRNSTRIESEWLDVPGLRTIQRRIAQLYAYDVCVARCGQREADRRFADQLSARRVSRILQLVEIDHTPVDILVTDDQRVVLGRPTMTAILDRYSRCVLGYHLSLAGHGVEAVFAALRHAMLPKTYLQERYADMNLEWDCFGWPELVLMDNGPEFHAKAVADALANLAVMTEYAASREPNDKPFVERFLRTFNYSFIHRLRGTTLAKVHQRIGFKAEDEACITLEELDRMIHIWITQVYHLRPHAGLQGRAPMTVWRESAQAYPPQLKLNSQDLDIEFSQITESALQHYGIDLNTFVYVNTRLLTLRRMLPAGKKVAVKWPSDDAGRIFVWDTIQEEYFEVPNKDADCSGLTVEQAKLVKKAKASADPNDQLAMASGQDLMRDMMEQAAADKKLKNRRKGARMGNVTSEAARSGRRRDATEPNSSSNAGVEVAEQNECGLFESIGHVDRAVEDLEVVEVEIIGGLE